MNPLLLFYRNENERNAVKAFMVSELREMAADMAMNDEPVNGVYEASRLIDKVFNRLEELYGDKPVASVQSTR